jgi:hypothetical protein
MPVGARRGSEPQLGRPSKSPTATSDVGVEHGQPIKGRREHHAIARAAVSVRASAPRFQVLGPARPQGRAQRDGYGRATRRRRLPRRCRLPARLSAWSRWHCSGTTAAERDHEDGQAAVERQLDRRAPRPFIPLRMGERRRAGGGKTMTVMTERDREDGEQRSSGNLTVERQDLSFRCEWESGAASRIAAARHDRHARGPRRRG